MIQQIWLLDFRLDYFEKVPVKYPVASHSREDVCACRLGKLEELVYRVGTQTPDLY